MGLADGVLDALGLALPVGVLVGVLEALALGMPDDDAVLEDDVLGDAELVGRLPVEVEV